MQHADDTIGLDCEGNMPAPSMSSHDDDVAVSRRHLCGPPAVDASRLAHRGRRVLSSEEIRQIASVLHPKAGANEAPALPDVGEADEVMRPVLGHIAASPGYSSGLNVMTGIDTFTGSPKLAVSVAVVALYATDVSVIFIGG